ncbi:MAG TPA: metalloregulator ArsR/SmtB family transcription factor [Phycisphaerales bacterium]|nr:metalloregulator ArsR/SmtB family transcription factor [Phycisphaerales bacterium]
MPKATHETPIGGARCARVFSALGDETRLALVARLSTGQPLSIARLAEGRGQSRQSITKHLRVLRHAGVVRGVRQGREHCFELRREAIDDARAALDRLTREWEMALHRLKHMLESEAVPSQEPRRKHKRGTS